MNKDEHSHTEARKSSNKGNVWFHPMEGCRTFCKFCKGLKSHISFRKIRCLTEMSEDWLVVMAGGGGGGVGSNKNTKPVWWSDLNIRIVFFDFISPFNP